MATIIERDVHHAAHDDSAESSMATFFIALVAIVVLIGLMLFLFRVYPFNAAPASVNDTSPGSTINIDATVPDYTTPQ